MSTLEPREIAPGGLIPSAFQKQLLKVRHVATVAAQRVDRNLHAGLNYGLAIGIVLCAFGWYQADKRFAENVQVIWVKLSPDGTHSVEYRDTSKPREYYATTVESRLSEWVERRYSKRRATILRDHGFAIEYMAPDMATDFLRTAPAAAAEHLACAACPDVHVQKRVFKGIDENISPDSRADRQFTTQVWARERQINREGIVTSCSNQLITIIWSFMPMAEIVKHKQEWIDDNPLGQRIIRSDMRADPTPVSIETCLKPV